MTGRIEKLSMLDANDILIRTTLDEVPEQYRDEVYIEKDDGEVVENWFVGTAGAVSYSGRFLTPEEWNGYQVSGKKRRTRLGSLNLPVFEKKEE